MGANSLPKTVTRQRRSCDLNPGSSAPESSTLTTRLPSHPSVCRVLITPSPIEERSIVMTVSVVFASISPEIHVRSLPNCLWPCSVLLWQRRDKVCTSGFVNDVVLAHELRHLNVAAQLIEAQPTRSLGLSYKRRVGIPVAGQWTHTHWPTYRAPRSTRPQWAC